MQEEETLQADCKDNIHGERRSMFVLSVPGLNDWVPDVEKERYEQDYSSQCVDSTATSNTPKRGMEEDEMDTDDHHVNVSFDPTDPVKRMKTGEANNDGSSSSPGKGILSAEYLLNSPIPERPSKACMVKVYEDFEKYKLNTLVDVIGFLSMDPVLDGSQDKLSDFEGIDVEEHISTNPPPSLIPRLHAIVIRDLRHINPLLDDGSMWNAEDSFVYKDLHKVLTQCLFGDQLAAHYLFCHLLSSIYARIDVENLGRCALNLSNLPPGVAASDYIRKLYEIVELLVPASHYFPLTLDNLNSTQFNPKKDFKTNRLTSGLLQLAPHTHLVIDETRLATGKLESAGVAALGSISQLIVNQIVKCDFQFYQLDFEADVPVLVFSEGKSILPSDFHCPLHVADADATRNIDETLKAAKQFVRSNSTEMRRFLTSQKLHAFSLGANIQGVIQNDLVELRRTFNMKPDDFHLFLNLSRLVGKSLGKTEADAETWELVKSLEMERRSRVEALPQRKAMES